MRPFLLSVTLHVTLGFVVLFAARPRTAAAGEVLRRALGQRWLAALLIAGALGNLSLRLAAGYINPRDYLQDVVAARQLLAGETLYPAELQRRATAETAGHFAGEAELRAVPFLAGEFRQLGSNVAQNAHPPFVALVTAGPVALLGARYSFLLVWLVSSVLLYGTFRFVLRELFGPLTAWARAALLAAAFGWYPVVSTLRSGQSGIWLLALCTASWALLRRGNGWLAGVPAGVAASLHAFPGLLLVYFLFRARKAFGGGVLTILVLNGLMMVVAGPGSYAEWLHTAGAVSQEYLPYRANYSVAGAVASLDRAMTGDVNGRALTLVITALGALAVAFWSGRRARRGLGPPELDVEFSACLVATLLVSPICWDRYFPVLLLPLAVALRYLPARMALFQALVIALVSIPGDTVDAIFGFLMPRVGTVAAWVLTSLPTMALLALLWFLGRQAGDGRTVNTAT